MKKDYFYTKASLIFALFYWILESTIHYSIFKEVEFQLIPHDLNELWMRIVIIFLLISFGFFADLHAYRILVKEREKREIYKAMINASQHILNNFLQSMTLFRDVAENSSDIDENIIKLYDQTINSATTQLNNLKDIENPNKESIEEKFLPK